MDTVQGGEEAEGENNTNEMISNEKTTIWWSGDEESLRFLKIPFCCFLSMENAKLMHAYVKRNQNLKKYVMW